MEEFTEIMEFDQEFVIKDPTNPWVRFRYLMVEGVAQNDLKYLRVDFIREGQEELIEVKLEDYINQFIDNALIIEGPLLDNIVDPNNNADSVSVKLTSLNPDMDFNSIKVSILCFTEYIIPSM